jgi:hypothetical protein
MSCLSCLDKKQQESVHDALDFIFERGAELIRKEAAKQGVVIDKSLEEKLKKYGVKHGILRAPTPDADPELTTL